MPRPLPATLPLHTRSVIRIIKAFRPMLADVMSAGAAEGGTEDLINPPLLFLVAEVGATVLFHREMGEKHVGGGVPAGIRHPVPQPQLLRLVEGEAMDGDARVLRDAPQERWSEGELKSVPVDAQTGNAEEEAVNVPEAPVLKVVVSRLKEAPIGFLKIQCWWLVTAGQERLPIDVLEIIGGLVPLEHASLVQGTWPG